MERELYESTPPKKQYEPPTVTQVYVDPAKDMLVACRPGKISGPRVCNRVQFT